MSTFNPSPVDQSEMILRQAQSFFANAAQDLRAYTHNELWASMLKLVEYVLHMATKMVDAILGLADIYDQSLAEIENQQLSSELLAVNRAQC